MTKGKQVDSTENKKKGGAIYVRIETMLIGVVLALVAGFVVGEVVNLSQPDTSVAPAPAPTFTPSPEPVPEQHVSPAALQRMLALEQQASLDPNNFMTWTELGNIYFDANQYDKAIEAYRKSLELKPGDADVLTDLGVMYRRKGQTTEALASFEKAMEADPRHEQSRFNKGVVLMFDLHDNQGAIKAWEDLLRVNPSAKASTGEPIKDLVERVKSNMEQQGP